MTDVNKKSEFDDLVSEGTVGRNPPTPLDKAAANLQTQLESERDKRLDERFLLVVIIVILADAVFFIKMENWGGPVVIGLIELLALIVFARQCGVQEVDRLLDRVTALPPFRTFAERHRREQSAFRKWKRRMADKERRSQAQR